jgi:hypothetical protein
MACFFVSPGQQQRLPGARFAFDEQDLALALLRAVQRAKDRLELRPASPYRAGPVWPLRSATASPRQVRYHDPPRHGTPEYLR